MGVVDDKRQVDADPDAERKRKERATRRIDTAILLGSVFFVFAVYKHRDGLDTQGGWVVFAALASASAGVLILWILDWMEES